MSPAMQCASRTRTDNWPDLSPPTHHHHPALWSWSNCCSYLRCSESAKPYFDYGETVMLNYYHIRAVPGVDFVSKTPNSTRDNDDNDDVMLLCHTCLQSRVSSCILYNMAESAQLHSVQTRVWRLILCTHTVENCCTHTCFSSWLCLDHDCDPSSGPIWSTVTGMMMLQRLVFSICLGRVHYDRTSAHFVPWRCLLICSAGKLQHCCQRNKVVATYSL